MEFLEAVEGIQAEGRTDLAGGFRDPLPRLRGRGMAVLVTDFYDRDGYAEGLLGLRRPRLQTHAVHLLSDDELEPTVHGRTILLDLESGERRKIDITREVVTRYRRVLDRYLGDVEQKAVENGISYTRVRAREDLEGMMTEILRGARFLTVRR
jgi:hypothetical protein